MSSPPRKTDHDATPWEKPPTTVVLGATVLLAMSLAFLQLKDVSGAAEFAIGIMHVAFTGYFLG